MLFNSQIFIFIFLPISLLVWYILRRFKLYNLSLAFLIGMSFWFYGYFNPWYLPILISSITINYLISFIMEKAARIRKLLLIIGLTFNICLLAYFKYFDFFISNINSVFKADFPLKHILLPLGISFFTLQQISFIIDRYKKSAPHYGILKYAAYVSFFPQLVAGPIVLHSELIPQFDSESSKRFDINSFTEGFVRFIMGLAKKVLIADLLAYPVNFGFEQIGLIDTPSAWVVGICYSLELYFDFSGYSDMACGLGKMFGITLPENFNSPYKAASIRDFWKRWHITLTRFLTSYIYIPLGGNKKGKFLTCLNIMIVFGISGFWHGASWSFVIWGLLHGIAMIISRRSFLKIKHKLPGRIITFIFLVITWTIFRSENMSTALMMLKKMFAFSANGYIVDIGSTMSLVPEFKAVLENILHIQTPFLYVVYTILLSGIILMAFILTFFKNPAQITASQKAKGYNIPFMIFLGIVFAVCVTFLTGVSTFLYFNF